MATTPAAKKPHPFEAAGLGHAPFHVTGHAEKTYCAGPGAPIQCGGSCDYCGTGIVDHYYIKGSGPGDKEFHVGSDCVRKTGDRVLIAKVKEIISKDQKLARRVKLAAQTAKRIAEAETKYGSLLNKLDTLAEKSTGYSASTAKDVARRAREGKELSEKTIALVEKLWAEYANPTPLVENALTKKLATLADAGLWGADIAADMLPRVRQGRSLSENQLNLINRLWADYERSKAPKPAPTGKAGDRVDLDLTLTQTKLIGTKVFNGHASSTYLWTFESKDGTQYKWFASHNLGKTMYDVPGPWSDKQLEAYRDEMYNKGVWRGVLACHVRGTITEHGEFRGISQTTLSRCKVTFK